MYIDEDQEDVNPEVLQHYYGTTADRPARRSHQTGAGHDPEEEPDSDQSDIDDILDTELNQTTDHVDLADRIAQDQAHHIRHDAVETPDVNPPFEASEIQQLLLHLLDEARDSNQLPTHYSIHPEEWEDGRYPSYEVIRTGRKGKKQLRISLPDEIWRP